MEQRWMESCECTQIIFILCLLCQIHGESLHQKISNPSSKRIQQPPLRLKQSTGSPSLNTRNVEKCQVKNYEPTEEEKLLEHIFNPGRDLSKILPKRKWNSDPLLVYLDVIISHVFSVNADKEDIDMTILITMKWKNELLHWNRSEFAGIKTISVSSKRVWTPQLALDENVETIISAPETSTVSLTWDQNNALSFLQTVKLKCPMNACKFPVDDHNCTMTFYILSYDDSQVKLLFHPVFVAKGRESNGTRKWKVSNVSFNSSESENHTIFTQIPKMDKFSRPALRFTLKITRKPTFYLVNIVLPNILLALVSICSTILPPDSGERSALLITCLLAFFVYLDTIWKHLPESSDYLPILICWIILILVNIIIQLFLCCVVSNWSQAAQDKKPMGKKARAFIHGVLRRVVCWSPEIVMKTFKDKIKQSTWHRPNVIINQSAQPVNEASQNQVTPELPMVPMNASVSNNKEDETAKGNEHCLAVKILDRISILFSIMLIAVGPAFFILTLFGAWDYDCLLPSAFY